MDLGHDDEVVEGMLVRRDVVLLHWHSTVYVHCAGIVDLEGRDDLVLRLLDDLLGLVELALGHCALFDGGELVFTVWVEVELFGKGRKVRVQVTT